MMTSQRTEWQRGLRAAILAPLMAITMAACGGGSGTNYLEGGGGSTGGGSTGGGSTGGGSTGGGGTTDPVPDTVTIGAMIDGTFVEGQVGVGVDTLSPGGTTEAAVNLVNQDGDPVTEVHTVEFTSRCTADGTATLVSPVEAEGGQAVAEYVASGCVGDDEIRAAVDVDGTTLVAVGTVVVEQEEIGSLQFVSAEPPQISIVGTGGDETSRVTFRLRGEAGGAIQGATVDFALNASTGGLDLTEDSAVTNRDGLVSTRVRAGTIATSVRVTATETTTDISTQSAQLVVSTGIPDQDSMSLSALPLNPEAWQYDGEEIEVTARAADAFNNPVPDGTAVSFYAEGGSIDPSCNTGGRQGACTLTWRSQNPRPDDGRVTLLATAIGNESFTDANGNGRFDDGEDFGDLGEAFANENESLTPEGEREYDVGEFFIDFGPDSDPNGIRDDPDGLYNGVLCATSNTGQCSGDRTVIVNDELVMVMASHVAAGLMDCSGPDEVYSPGTNPIPVDGTSDAPITVANVRSCTLVLGDRNWNALPFETEVSIEVTNGLELSGTDSFEWPSATNFVLLGVTISQADEDNPVGGQFIVNVETPKGNLSSVTWSVSP